MRDRVSFVPASAVFVEQVDCRCAEGICAAPLWATARTTIIVDCPIRHGVFHATESAGLPLGSHADQHRADTISDDARRRASAASTQAIRIHHARHALPDRSMPDDKMP